jgi:hypothetical protein
MIAFNGLEQAHKRKSDAGIPLSGSQAEAGQIGGT